MRELPFRVRLGDSRVLVRGRVPFLERVEDFRVVEAQVVGALALRERVEIAAVDVPGQPVRGGVLRLDRFLVVVLHQLAQRAFRQLVRLVERSSPGCLCLRPFAARSVARNEPFHLLRDRIAPVQFVVGEQDPLLPGRGARVVRRLLLQQPVDPDGMVELAALEISRRQPVDELDRRASRLPVEIRGRGLHGLRLRERQDEVLQGLALQLDNRVRCSRTRRACTRRTRRPSAT